VPSPKFQERLVMLSVEVSVKVTVKGGSARCRAKGPVVAGAVIALTSFENPLTIVGEVLLFAVLQAVCGGGLKVSTPSIRGVARGALPASRPNTGVVKRKNQTLRD
jgi:hypothetical protein